MNCKIYISDEGFGPIVRESAIIEALRTLRDDIDFTIQTETHASKIKSFIENVEVRSKFNNILWSKKEDGSPNLSKIKLFFSDYSARADNYIIDELKDFQYDFVLSDFVYEAFHVAVKKGKPSFGVAHFTWDWFFSKMFPPPINDKVLKRFFESANGADAIFFPPFTPEEIITHYKKKAIEVPLIVRKKKNNKNVRDKNAFKVLIMDSGSSVIAPYIQQSLEHLNKIGDIHFYLSSKFSCQSENVIYIDPEEIFSDYIPYMDMVISRAGFNTISECIACKTPLLMVGEAVNPEMAENMLNIKKASLGSMIDIETIARDLSNFLPRFIENEYKHLKYNLENAELETNGADVIAEYILNRLDKN